MSHYEIIAIMLSVAAGLFKNPRMAIGIYFLVNICFLLAYFELGLYMACISLGFAAMRNVAALTLDEKYNVYSAVFFTCMIILIICSQINHYTDILIVLAAAALGLTAYFRDNLKLYWSATIVSQLLWVIHSLIWDVYSMAICCAIITGTGLYAILKNTDFYVFKVKKDNDLVVVN